MKLNVIKYKKIPFIASGLLSIASVIIILIFGFKFGIDFMGGSLLEVRFTQEAPGIAEIQESLEPLELGNIQVQPTDDEGLFIRMPFVGEEKHQEVLATLRESFESDDQRVQEDRFETIGPAISSQLRTRAISITFAVIISIIVFVAYAFRKVSKPVQSWKYGLAAIVALVHDILLTLAIFSLLGHFVGVELDIPFIVALMTILGYSVNDTIVVFDRVRENLLRKGSGRFVECVNEGVNSTITRSINTSVTTLLVLSALFFFGGDTIHYFSLALILGIIFGTYSSIFLASPLLVVWKDLSDRRDAQKAKKA